MMPTYVTSGRDPLQPTNEQLNSLGVQSDAEYERGIAELRKEWGRDYNRNVQAVQAYVDELPTGQRKRYDSPEGARKVLPSALAMMKVKQGRKQ